jgi:peptidoglycan/xylan/chitin deacetylase (PgdA/CDA1 family)
MTLMLHPGTQVFDSAAFLKEFIALLEANDMKVITYQDILKDPGITAREQGKLAIISIDDIYLQNILDSSIKMMISMLLEAHIPAVLGVVTQGNVPNAETAGLLKRFGEAGWEIATHTDTHPFLAELERSSPGSVSLEIRTSQDKIESATGLRPVTLILPYGQSVYDLSLISNEGIRWVVGIGGGNTYDTTRDVFFVGREGPDGTPPMTFNIMMRRFNSDLVLP